MKKYKIESNADFILGEYYAIVNSEEKIVDTFLANNLERCAKHLDNYTKRGCEIWLHLSPEEAQEASLEYRSEENYIYQSFERRAHSRSETYLMECCRLATLSAKVKRIFCVGV